MTDAMRKIVFKEMLCHRILLLSRKSIRKKICVKKAVAASARSMLNLNTKINMITKNMGQMLRMRLSRLFRNFPPVFSSGRRWTCLKRMINPRIAARTVKGN
ncbi:hypothetical protein ES703_121197 [subsurface metagenome]